MPTFILLTKLSSQGLGSIQKRENIGMEWSKEVNKEMSGSKMDRTLCFVRFI